MLRTKENIQKAAEVLTNSFKKQIEELTGRLPVVIISFNDTWLSPLFLEELESIVNYNFHENYPKGEFWCPDGIRTKTRRKELRQCRQIFYYIARKMGYSLHHLARHLNQNHATVLHAERVVTNELDTNNQEFVILYNNIIHDYQKRLESKRLIQQSDSPQSNPKRILSPVLYAGIDKSKLDKPASGT